jgi:hypothetical protein
MFATKIVIDNTSRDSRFFADQRNTRGVQTHSIDHSHSGLNKLWFTYIRHPNLRHFSVLLFFIERSVKYKMTEI